ncbi:MAG: FliI/YscN family ATPase [Pseudomonadota bacterium]
MIFDLQLVERTLASTSPVRWRGQVVRVQGLLVVAEGVRAPIGAVVEIGNAPHLTRAEVVGFEKQDSLLMPFAALHGLASGSPVRLAPHAELIPTASRLLGRVVDPFGCAIDAGPPLDHFDGEPLRSAAPSPLTRRPITQRLETGIRAIDALISVGRGQRLGIVAGAGLGKSTLLGMLARHVHCDAVVLALVGERGREVREFLEVHLGPAADRCAVVVATSDTSPVVRVRAVETATVIAEGLRRRGLHTLLLVDSLTRVAMAQREIGLSLGEPPTTRGYTPSAFALLPPLIERAGCGTPAEGDITAFYTVLVEGDAVLDDPIADAARGLLDGLVVLDRRLAEQGVYPAIDIAASQSRLMDALVDRSHAELARRVRRIHTVYREAEELINLGAYRAGTNPEVDRAMARRPALLKLLQQTAEQRESFTASVQALREITTGATKAETP